MRFVDTNIFVYVLEAHPTYGEISKKILERIEKGERALTSAIVLAEIAWVLEAMGRQSYIKPALEKILSYESLTIKEITAEDLVEGSLCMRDYKVDFNDGVNLAIMEREGIKEIYTNDKKHLGSVEWLETVFE